MLWKKYLCATHALSLGVSVTLAACSTLKAPVPSDPDAYTEYKENNDPYEPMNRGFYDFTMKADKYVMKPVAKTYVAVVPKKVRSVFRNIIQTMNEPTVFFSAVGAGNPRMAGDTFMRFLINMTAGLGGLFDVAKYAGYYQQDIDPNLTLGKWGVPNGPYLFVPLVGPGSPRSVMGSILAIGLPPFTYVPRGYNLITFNWAYNILDVVDSRANNLDATDIVEKDSLDPYAFIRSATQQQMKARLDNIRNDRRATVPAWYKLN